MICRPAVALLGCRIALRCGKPCLNLIIEDARELFELATELRGWIGVRNVLWTRLMAERVGDFSWPAMFDLLQDGLGPLERLADTAREWPELVLGEIEIVDWYDGPVVALTSSASDGRRLLAILLAVEHARPWRIYGLLEVTPEAADTLALAPRSPDVPLDAATWARLMRAVTKSVHRPRSPHLWLVRARALEPSSTSSSHAEGAVVAEPKGTSEPTFM